MQPTFCDTNKTIIKCYRSFFYRGLRISPSLWQYVILFYGFRVNATATLLYVILSHFSGVVILIYYYTLYYTLRILHETLRVLLHYFLVHPPLFFGWPIQHQVTNPTNYTWKDTAYPYNIRRKTYMSQAFSSKKWK